MKNATVAPKSFDSVVSPIADEFLTDQIEPAESIPEIDVNDELDYLALFGMGEPLPSVDYSDEFEPDYESMYEDMLEAHYSEPRWF